MVVPRKCTESDSGIHMDNVNGSEKEFVTDGSYPVDGEYVG
jgi:hypothetical protein